MRTAIYARFSSDLQNDRSVEDQNALCRGYADRAGWRVSGTFADHAVSGSSIHNRPDYQRMIGLAAAGEIDVILAEGLDRLSRSLSDTARLFENMAFHGVKIVTVADGEINAMHVGLKGTMSALFLKDLADKTKRGMAGVIREGRHAGGRAYGYKTVPGNPGGLVIADAEADVVRRIFADYVAGKSPRTIAGELNADGVPPPRGTYWAAVTLNGNLKRGHGILLNPLYVGRLVWNRVRMVKDPETGKRISRVNPEAEWQEQAVPALAIVDSETFAAAAAKRGGRAEMAPRDRTTPRHLLSGLLRCGSCGAGMSVKDRHRERIRVRCTKATESGSCENARAYQLDIIEAAVVGGLRERMVDRDGIALYVRIYNEERQALAADSVNRRARIERRLAQAEREQDRVYKAFVMGLIEEDQVKRDLPPRKAECEALRAELALCDDPPNVVTLHPATVSRYLASIEMLERTVRDGEPYGAESKKALRDLISTVTVHEAPAGTSPEIEVAGHLTNLIGGDHFPTSKAGGGRMVAGEGLIPPPTSDSRAILVQKSGQMKTSPVSRSISRRFRQ